MKEKDDNKQREQLKRELVNAYQRLEEAETGRIERQAIEQGLGQSTRILGHLQKMELVSQLAGNIAQYFNNILTLIIGYGSFLQTHLNEGDPLKPYVHQILASSERAALLTRSLLTYSRKQVVNPKPVNINEVIRRAGKLIQRIIGERIEFRTRLSGREVAVSADAVQLEQALMNLATNARDAMPEGGTLTIEAKLVELGSQTKAGSVENPWKCAVISFSDTGVGMDEGLKERIFEPFYTTKEPGKGTGLGLSLVYGIVKQHNGSINVSSEPGKGTTFSIYLPVVNGRAVQNHGESSVAVFEGSSYCS